MLYNRIELKGGIQLAGIVIKTDHKCQLSIKERKLKHHSKSLERIGSHRQYHLATNVLLHSDGGFNAGLAGSDAFLIKRDTNFKSVRNFLVENHAIPFISLAALCQLMTIVQRQRGFHSINVIPCFSKGK